MILRAKLTSCRSFILLVIIGLLFLTVNIGLIWNQQQSAPQNICVCEPSINVPNSNVDSKKKSLESSKETQEDKIPDSALILPEDQTVESVDTHQLAVVVPFRNRYEEMIKFVPHIHKFLDRQKVKHQILVINQADRHRYSKCKSVVENYSITRVHVGQIMWFMWWYLNLLCSSCILLTIVFYLTSSIDYRFNRASLLNIGFLLSRNECDYMVMHDVDLLPMNDDLQYSYPTKGPLHISSPELHPLYHYATFVGGILIMSRKQFEKVQETSG